MTYTPIADLQREVAHYFKLPARVMTSRDQSYSITRPRQVAMLLANELLGKSPAELARRFKREKSTVKRALQRTRRYIADDPQFAAQVEALRERLA